MQGVNQQSSSGGSSTTATTTEPHPRDKAACLFSIEDPHPGLFAVVKLGRLLRPEAEKAKDKEAELTLKVRKSAISMYSIVREDSFNISGIGRAVQLACKVHSTNCMGCRTGVC